MKKCNTNNCMIILSSMIELDYIVEIISAKCGLNWGGMNGVLLTSLENHCKIIRTRVDRVKSSQIDHIKIQYFVS